MAGTGELTGEALFLSNLLDSQKLDITGMVCDITKIFDDIKVLSRDSSSFSAQILATIKSGSAPVLNEYLKKTPNVFLKIIFGRKDDNSDLVERSIYKYLTKLIINHHTPNIMRFVAAFKCNNIFAMIIPIKAGAGLKFTEIIEDIELIPDIDTNNITVAVLERGIGKPLRVVLKDKISEHEFKNIMFQVFYTLREMHIAKVRHNDLHTENVWINILSAPVRMIYFVNDNEYAMIETRYVVKIYDFDRSTFTAGNLPNKILDKVFCPKYGMCSNDNPYFDPHTLCFLLNMEFAHVSHIVSFVKEVIRNKKYLNDGCCTFPGRMCDKPSSFTISHAPATVGSASSSPSPPPGFASRSSPRYPSKSPGSPNQPPTPWSGGSTSQYTPVNKPAAIVVQDTSCNKNFVPDSGDIYDFTDLWNKTNVFNHIKKSLTDSGYEKRDVPIIKSAAYNDVPEFVFKSDPQVFFSQTCSSSPVLMANKLFDIYG
jgi:serine/threonine protein kinase